jgi:hypothetical protein
MTIQRITRKKGKEIILEQQELSEPINNKDVVIMLMNKREKRIGTWIIKK